MRWLLFGATCVLFTGCSSPSTVDPETGHVSGELVFQRYCVSCHGMGGQLKAGGKIQLQHTKMTDSLLRQTILYGKNNAMPAYKKMLSDEETTAVINYINTVIKK